MLDRSRMLSVRGQHLVDADGTVVRLRGVGLGGWMNMENFITGYPATEGLMRSAVRAVLGAERYELFFDRLLTRFFDTADAAFLAGLGLNCLRIPVNYRHFEDDDRPLRIRSEGFRHLDRVIEACARHGIYTVIDLHALPGGQNQHWHSDNPTHVAAFWQHRGFQDRVVHLWEVLADHYRDLPWVAGYNLVNEPADPTGEVVGPFYERLTSAVRAVDPHHVLFLDANTYSTDFSIFSDVTPNTVYVCHDYALAGFAYAGEYPGRTRGEWVDRDVLERKFLARTAFQRETGTPIWVGEFGPVYTGEPDRDAQRYAVLSDQLGIYEAYEAGWSLWTYKDVGLQGLVHAHPDGAYLRHFRDVLAKKSRLGVDAWGSTDEEAAESVEPVQRLVAAEFPGYQPYPWSARDHVDDIVRHILLAQALLPEYAERFRGLGDGDLIALADSFALEACVRRERLCDLLGDLLGEHRPGAAAGDSTSAPGSAP